MLVAGGLAALHGAAEASATPATSEPSVDQAGTIAGTPCTATVRACVDLTRQRAWLIQGGEVVRGPIPITSGGPGEETPTGDFKVQWKDKNHVSDNVAGTPMPFSVFFAPGGVAFHGGGLRRESAGCVLLAEPDATAFYDDLALGDAVQVRGNGPHGPSAPHR